MTDRATAQRLVRSSVAALACATATVISATLLARRDEPAPATAAVTGGLALAAAVFATVGASAALGSDARGVGATELGAMLERIERIARAGTIGDSAAAEAAFASIARSARECAALVAGNFPSPSEVERIR